MGLFLTLAFLFFVGSMLGWVVELLFRAAVHPEHKWINPGFCTGPYVPLYGFGLCLLFLLALLENRHLIASPLGNKLATIAAMAVAMTAIEYLAGVLSIKVMKVRLWDYSNMPGNIQGIICPQFSLIWAAIAAVYDLFVHPYILDALHWLSQNLAFSFFIGLFFGVFLIDVAHSAQIVARLRKFAADNDVEVRYEALKADIRRRARERAGKYHFFRPFRSDLPLSEHLKAMYESLEERRKHK